MTEIRLSQGTYRQAMQLARPALRCKAEEIQSRAKQIAATEGVEFDTEVTEGTRPKGRAFARVVAPDGAEQEWGTSRTERRRILGRAAEGGA